MTWPAADPVQDLTPGPVIVIDPAGALPPVDPDAADLCLTARTGAPAPWVALADPLAGADRVRRAVATQPIAAEVLLRLLRRAEGLEPERALEMESLAYSALLAAPGFRAWLDRRGPLPPAPAPADPLHLARAGDAVTLTLADPGALNALSARMRDGLVAALETCLLDPTRPSVTLRGQGQAFCAGGALGEFGLSADPALAHLIRRSQSVAGLVLRLGARAQAVVQGAAIGAGCEIAAAAGRVRAGPGAWFALPELAMGLIPGAGGTVTVPRRIGRHRAAWLMLTGQRIGAARALDWGLVDVVGTG